MMLPLIIIFGICRDSRTVFRGVKHTLILERDSPMKYMYRTGVAGAADGQFTIRWLTLWKPKITSSAADMLEL
jgi:hypothetical protein